VFSGVLFLSYPENSSNGLLKDSSEERKKNKWVVCWPAGVPLRLNVGRKGERAISLRKKAKKIKFR
jgi:hypothetical protein